VAYQQVMVALVVLAFIAVAGSGLFLAIEYAAKRLSAAIVATEEETATFQREQGSNLSRGARQPPVSLDA
jgi:hypothetical protein